MTFQEIVARYLLKIGQEYGNSSESDEQTNHRMKEAYWTICKFTGATWVKPTLATIPNMTGLENRLVLTAILPENTCDEVFGIHSVSWEGLMLYHWNKASLDARAAYGTPPATSPIAYASWEEYDGIITNDKITCIAIFPPNNAAVNDTSCYISYYDRPIAPIIATWSTTYPELASENHSVIAELMALEYLKDRGDRRWTQNRERDVWDKINATRQKFTTQISRGRVFASPFDPSATKSFYGE